MIRWPLFVIGVGLIVCAAIAKLQQPPLATEARRVTLAEALALVGGSAKHLVELNARLDTNRRIYSTGDEFSRPVYTANPPDQVYPIETGPEQGQWARYLGNMVRVPVGLESHFLRLQTVRDRALEAKQVVKERLLAPLQGTGYRLWALSAPFSADDSQGRAWLGQRQVQGYLTRFKDLEANRKYPKFEHDLAEIYRFAREKFGRAIPDDACVLLTDFKSFPQAVTYFYCAVKDSQNTLFYSLTPSTVTTVPEILRGILEPAKLELYGDFASALNASLPTRIGILTPGSAEAHNQRTADGIRTVFTTGSVLALLGFAGIVWKRKRRPPRKPNA